MWERELSVSIKIAKEAGERIMEIYDDPDLWNIEYKDDRSPLTCADKASNDIIVGALKKEFASYAILSEEEKDNRERLENDYCFVVDPLDGTKEFIKRNGQFTVNIALAYKHKSVMGVIYVPATRELYYASIGEGAWYMDAHGKKARIYVSSNADHNDLSAVVSGSHPCEEMERMIEKYNITNLLRIGSSLKGCLVAKGDADIYYRHNPTMEWDTAAMQCIVEEAGGIFRQMDDTEMLYNRENSLNSKGFYAINRSENRLY
ncbi:MAG: 3'(2'),5'-bisphosphate nucleotidase CysQ [Lachnospiraceae bacterium]|nr:3'(2'),5'-bisphosphate nucleotidase CysQ [Lachnospiraceae bacterium]